MLSRSFHQEDIVTLDLKATPPGGGGQWALNLGMCPWQEGAVNEVGVPEGHQGEDRSLDL